MKKNYFILLTISHTEIKQMRPIYKHIPHYNSSGILRSAELMNPQNVLSAN